MIVENGLWHPVASATGLQDKPQPGVLLGRNLVLWRDGAGRAHAWADQCPHRGAKLSLGRVCNNQLECAYHGWQFAADDGQCILVPAQPQWQAPVSHKATVYEACERYGLIWVRLEASTSSLPRFEWDDQTDLRKVLCGPYIVDTSAPRLVENFLDMSHFGFVHEGWLGAREHTQMDAYEVVEGASAGLEAGVLARDCRVVQPQAFAGSQAASEISYRYEVRAPYYCLLEKNAPEGGASNAIGMFICPVGDEQSICWFRMASKNDGSSDQSLIDFQDTIFAQDKPIVESQVPKRLPIGLHAAIAEVHGPLDRIASAYRRYLKKQGVSVGVC